MESLKVGVVVARKETIAQKGKYWVQELFENEEIVSHFELPSIF